MVREELVHSAVSFLQDPTVASAPLEKKIAFLQSKNLTRNEIDIALARTSDGSISPSTNVAPGPEAYRQGSQQPPGYNPYTAYWQPPTPTVPRRDWRDWFIMATVMGGVGFALYISAKRYILPLISPPTPHQLSQDKASVDESFEKAFALLDQLHKDTTALKVAEDSRNSRLGAALAELESVLSLLKESDRRREDDARRNADEIRMLKSLIPKALDTEKHNRDERIQELVSELRSLKTLMGNRMGGGPMSAGAGAHRPSSSIGSGPGVAVGGVLQGTVQPHSSSTLSGGSSAAGGAHDTQQRGDMSAAESSMSSSTASGGISFRGGRGAAIPDWQRAAASKNATGAAGAVDGVQKSSEASEAQS